MIGIQPGETTTLVFGDRLVTALVRETRVSVSTPTLIDVTGFGDTANHFVPAAGRSVTEVTKEQATAVAALIEEVAPGARQIDLEGA